MEPIRVTVLRSLVRASIHSLGLWSLNAEELLLMICAHETHCGALGTMQVGGGPALGLWQMEPPTFMDVFSLVVPRRPAFRVTLSLLAGTPNMHAELMRSQHAFACAMARLQLWRFSEPLPRSTDVSAMAQYASQYWNRGGKGTPDKYASDYREFIL